MHVKEIYFSSLMFFNPLPKDKILDWFELKAFTDKKINMTCGKKRCNAGYMACM